MVQTKVGCNLTNTLRGKLLARTRSHFGCGVSSSLPKSIPLSSGSSLSLSASRSLRFCCLGLVDAIRSATGAPSRSPKFGFGFLDGARPAQTTGQRNQLTLVRINTTTNMTNRRSRRRRCRWLKTCGTPGTRPSVHLRDNK